MNLHKLSILIIIPKQTNITLDMKIYGQVLSREQMARLRELGVDTSDASMAWMSNSDNPKADDWTIEIPNEFLEHYYQVPTYTIGDLIDKLPKAIEGNCLVINYIYSEIIYAKAAGMPIAFRHRMRAAVILSFGLQCIL